MVRALLVGFLLVASCSDTTAMEVGTNFWDVGWGGERNDPFVDGFKNVKGDNPWKPEFLDEIRIYTVLRFMDWGKTNNRSDDAGKTWRAVNGVGMPRRVGGQGQSPYMTLQIKELAVDPRDPNVVYAGNQLWVTAGVYKTVDGGQHQIRTTRLAPQDEANMDYGWIDFWGPAVECLSASPVRPGRVAFGTGGQVFTSDDGGGTWQQRYCAPLPDGRFYGNGMEVTCVNTIVPDPTTRERLWLCYADSRTGFV